EVADAVRVLPLTGRSRLTSSGHLKENYSSTSNGVNPVRNNTGRYPRPELIPYSMES
ncbi:MAG: hypothetical protein UX17_C0018G0012, partial [Parcubacteria group bacterium GW2011_GWC2_45_7]